MSCLPQNLPYHFNYSFCFAAVVFLKTYCYIVIPLDLAIF